MVGSSYDKSLKKYSRATRRRSVLTLDSVTRIFNNNSNTDKKNVRRFFFVKNFNNYNTNGTIFLKEILIKKCTGRYGRTARQTQVSGCVRASNVRGPQRARIQATMKTRHRSTAKTTAAAAKR